MAKKTKTEFGAFSVAATTGATGDVTVSGCIPNRWARGTRKGGLITVTATSSEPTCFVSAAWVDNSGYIAVHLRWVDGKPAANANVSFTLHVTFTP